MVPQIVKKDDSNIDSTLVITVDYTRTLKQMIVAGCYDWTNEDITAGHFPISGTGKVTVGLELVHLDRIVSTSEVLCALEERGLRPATLVELLAFGEKYPEEQRKYPIVALGSAWQSPRGRHVPYLHRGDAKRDLDLAWNDRDWGGVFRFLAVRK